MLYAESKSVLILVLPNLNMLMSHNIFVLMFDFVIIMNYNNACIMSVNIHERFDSPPKNV